MQDDHDMHDETPLGHADPRYVRGAVEEIMHPVTVDAPPSRDEMLAAAWRVIAHARALVGDRDVKTGVRSSGASIDTISDRARTLRAAIDEYDHFMVRVDPWPTY